MAVAGWWWFATGPIWLLLWLLGPGKHTRRASNNTLYGMIFVRNDAHSHPPDFAGQRASQLGGGLNMMAGGVSAEYSRISHCFSLPFLLSENFRNRCSESVEA